PRPRLLTLAPSSLLMLGLAFAAAGAVDSWILVAYERFLERFVSGTTLDLLHFSLHPISATRLAIACGLVLLHASVIWTAAAVLRVPNVVRRTPRRSRVAAVALAGWLVGIAAGLAALRASNLSVPLGPLVVALGVAGGCAAAIGQLRGRARRASQTARLTAVFLALLVPALAMYPSLLAFATAAKERLVETEIGPQVVRQREELKERLYATLEQIDTLSSLPDLVAAAPPATSPTTDRAFLVWSKTDLAIHRLTSAVELYNASGTLISRFALNLPEYATASHQAA